MKKCPKCNQTFSDDNSFCLMDGTTLTLINTTDETSTVFPTGNDAPTQFIPSEKTVGEKSNNNIPGWVYMIMGIMGTALIALVTFIFLLQDKDKNEFTSLSKSNSSNVTKTEETSKESKSYEPNKAREDVEFKTEKKKTPIPPSPPKFVFTSPSGNWSGDWNSKSTSYTATAYFSEASGKITGQINWNLRRTKNPKKINKVGSSATEYVRGTFDSKTGKIFLKGYRKDDPQNIVILDRYNLSMSKNNKQIRGRSINGRFVLGR